VTVDMAPEVAALGVKVIFMDPPEAAAQTTISRPVAPTLAPAATTDEMPHGQGAEKTSDAIYLPAQRLALFATPFATNTLLASDGTLWDA
jgi:hypothetical protein